MFTGIVEHLGRVTEVSDLEGGRRLQIDAGRLADIEVGDSVAVNGTCLTVDTCGDGWLAFYVMGETLSRTNLATVGEGDMVNLERPLAAAGRFDGHIVQGHVDATGSVRRVVTEGDSRRMWIDTPTDILRYVVEKGSITVDGVSLTVSGVAPDGFEVALIPHTLAATTLGSRQEGEAVNLEVDVLAKYVERMLGAAL